MDDALFEQAIADVLETDAIGQRLNPSAHDLRQRDLIDALRNERTALLWRGIPEVEQLTLAYIQIAELGASVQEREVLTTLQEKLRDTEAAQSTAIVHEQEQRAKISVIRAENTTARALTPIEPVRRRSRLFRKRDRDDERELAYMRAMEELQNRKKHIADIVTTKYRLRLELHRFAFELASRTSRPGTGRLTRRLPLLASGSIGRAPTSPRRWSANWCRRP